MAEQQEPTEQREWTVDDDMAVFRKVKRAIDAVPDASYGRVRDYLHHLLEERVRRMRERSHAVLAQLARDVQKGFPFPLPRPGLPAGDEDVTPGPVAVDGVKEWRGTGSPR